VMDLKQMLTVVVMIVGDDDLEQVFGGGYIS
jgi:hypothetical protein